MTVVGDFERDLVAGIERCRALRSQNDYVLFGYLAEADRAGIWLQDGCRDMDEWVAGRFGISRWQAGRWVDAAHRLDSLPRIAHAFQSGGLGVEKVVELTRYATPETERSLVRWATKVTPATIRRHADLACSPVLEDAREPEASRHLKWWWDLDGASLWLEGRLPALEAKAFIAAVDKIAKTLPQEPEELDEDALGRMCETERRWVHDEARDRRRADALSVLAQGSVEGLRAADATLVVHFELDALQAGGSAAALEGGPVLHPETARRLACDCRLEVVAYDGGRTIGIKRASRHVPRYLRRQLLKRDDHTCQFPGCGRTAYLQEHHIIAWEDGGPTDLDNLVSLCHFHHKLVHEYRWRVALGAVPGTADWFRPDGSRYVPQPVLRAPPAVELPLAV